jgi:hypothetical protein
MSGVVVVRVRPEQRTSSSAKGFNSQRGRFRDAWFAFAEIQNQHTSIGDDFVASNPVHKV